jgi:hypothetical protein
MKTCFKQTEILMGSNQALRDYVEFFRTTAKNTLEALNKSFDNHQNVALLSHLYTIIGYLKDGLFDHHNYEDSLFSNLDARELFQKEMRDGLKTIIYYVYALESSITFDETIGANEADMILKYSEIDKMIEKLCDLICEFTKKEDYMISQIEEGLKSQEAIFT